jgi:1-acyl-sn-glycerol-3-phosphate acyltransferase
MLVVAMRSEVRHDCGHRAHTVRRNGARFETVEAMNRVGRGAAGIVAEVLASAIRLMAWTTVRYAGCSTATLTRQSIFFANHSSHLDFVVLWSALPQSARAMTRPVAAADYWNGGPLRRMLATHVFRAVLVQRGDDARDQATKLKNAEVLRRALAAGESLILFPEGTRGDGEVVGPFRSGLFRLAEQWPQVQLMPVRLDNLNCILPKGSMLPAPRGSTLTFRPPIKVRDGETKEEFLARAREAVAG